MSNCIFCKIAAGEIPSKKLYEDVDMLAFWDIRPLSQVHFLVIPKKHIESILELDAADTLLVGKMFHKAKELAKEQGCAIKGGNFLINAKTDGGQTVDHLHIHFLGGRKKFKLILGLIRNFFVTRRRN